MIAGVREAVRNCLARSPDLSIRQIADVTGLSYVQVKKARSYLKDPGRYRIVKQQYLRGRGVKPAAVVVAERRAEAADAASPIVELRKRGMTFSQIAKKLKLTKDQVAGHVRRARIASSKTRA